MDEGSWELCEEGEKLWYNSRLPIFNKEIYQKYREHLVKCKECQEKLGIDEFNVQLLIGDMKQKKMEEREKKIEVVADLLKKLLPVLVGVEDTFRVVLEEYNTKTEEANIIIDSNELGELMHIAFIRNEFDEKETKIAELLLAMLPMMLSGAFEDMFIKKETE